MIKSYKYRLLPTEDQKMTLSKWFGACRFVYNLALETKIAAWQSLRKNLSSYDLMKQITELKHTECQWLKECPGQSLDSCMAHLDHAYKTFFRGGGFPKYKKKYSEQSIKFRQAVSVKGGRIRLCKIGWIDFIEHRPVGLGEIRNATVKRTTTGDYYVSIMIKFDKESPAKKDVDEPTSIGVDLGLKTFATLSNGQYVNNPRLLQSSFKRLKVEQRKLSRRYKKGIKASAQSKGWEAQRLVVARLYEKIKNQRQDFLHKTSTAIIKQFDTIFVEDLNVGGLKKNKSLSSAISDAAWGEFIRQLEYKANWYGNNLIPIGRFEPSSKICFSCGFVKETIRMDERQWTCEGCGSTHDRDLNAAKNIKKIGLNAQPSPANVAEYSERIGCESLRRSY